MPADSLPPALPAAATSTGIGRPSAARRIAGEALPPALAHLVDGALRSATRGRSGLRLILATLAHHHRRAGHLWTSGDPVIASVLRGILREQKRPVRPAAALTSAELRQLLAGCGGSVANGGSATVGVEARQRLDG